jgi:hypothetical protein
MEQRAIGLHGDRDSGKEIPGSSLPSRRQHCPRQINDEMQRHKTTEKMLPVAPSASAKGFRVERWHPLDSSAVLPPGAASAGSSSPDPQKVPISNSQLQDRISSRLPATLRDFMLA